MIDRWKMIWIKSTIKQSQQKIMPDIDNHDKSKKESQFQNHSTSTFEKRLVQNQSESERLKRWLLSENYESEMLWIRNLNPRILLLKFLHQNITRLLRRMNRDEWRSKLNQKRSPRRMKDHFHFTIEILRNINKDFHLKLLLMMNCSNQDSKQKSLHRVWLLRCSNKWWQLTRWKEKKESDETLNWVIKKQSCHLEWRCMRKSKNKNRSLSLKLRNRMKSQKLFEHEMFLILINFKRTSKIT